LKYLHFCVFLLLLTSITAFSYGNHGNVDSHPRRRSKNQLSPRSASQDTEDKLAWFRNAKYGFFIHWGLYAIPAGEWKGKQIRISSEWIMAHATIPVKEYEQLTKQFNPVQFNADRWVQMVKNAGMKYIVFTAKHGDGFAMYHSRVTPYNIYDATPFHRDPLKELAEACKKYGIKMGIYYSQSVDWHEPGGEGNSWDFARDSEKDKNGAFDNYLQNKVEPQLKELLTNYGPICEIFFDTPALMTPPRAQRLADIVHTLQPRCLIDGRLGVPGDYSTMGDNGIPNADVTGDWETPGELNHNWGFDKNDEDYKSPGQVLFNLIDIISKGGNYLLDVGPDAFGKIPMVAEKNLEAVGHWLDINGDAVYGTERSPFAESYGGYGRKIQDPNGKVTYLPFLNWRCTAKPGKLYFSIFNWSGSGFKLPVFKNEIKKVYLLSDPAQTAIPFINDNGTRTVQTQHYAPTVMANVLVVELKGEKLEL